MRLLSPMPSCCKRGTQWRCEATHRRVPAWSVHQVPQPCHFAAWKCATATPSFPCQTRHITRRIHHGSNPETSRAKFLAAKGSHKQCCTRGPQPLIRTHEAGNPHVFNFNSLEHLEHRPSLPLHFFCTSRGAVCAGDCKRERDSKKSLTFHP